MRSRLGLRLGLLVLCLLMFPAPAWAQGDDPLTRALAAYRDLDYDGAATRLRAALAATGNNRLGDADRSRALMHLGATELFRSRRDAAAEAFRLLLQGDPKYRPDDLVFPPEITASFNEVRLGVRAVAVVVPAETELRSTGDRVPIRIYASTLHEIRVQVVGVDPLRSNDIVHDGAVGDSLEVLWSVRDAGGLPRQPGRYTLRVTSKGPTGRDEREVRIPLEVERLPTDTLPWPSPPDPTQLRPETTAGQRTSRPLIVGMAAAAVAALLPSIAGSSDEGSALRFGVAGVVGVTGVVGMVRSSRPRPVAENIEYNRGIRAAWEQERARVQQENATRSAAARLRVRAGRATVAEAR